MTATIAFGQLHYLFTYCKRHPVEITSTSGEGCNNRSNYIWSRQICVGESNNLANIIRSRLILHVGESVIILQRLSVETIFTSGGERKNPFNGNV